MSEELPTFAMKPLRKCIAVFNVSRANRVAIHASDPLSAREYAALIRMMELDRETMLECEDAAMEKTDGE